MMLKPSSEADAAQIASETGLKPPHSVDIEQALLGAILVYNECVDSFVDFLAGHHFFDPLHETIYDVMIGVIQSGKPATPTTIKPFFDAAAPISSMMTVPQYLGRLAARACTFGQAKHYARDIYNLAARRALMIIGEDIASSASYLADGIDPNVLIEEAEHRLYAVSEHHTGSDKAVTWSQAADKAMARASDAYARNGGLAGLSTGLIDLDRLLGGLAPTDLIILAGRPSMGKTALATNIAWDVASRQGVPVGFFSLEMSDDQLATRILAERAGVPSEATRRGTITEAQWRALDEARNEYRKIPMTIDARGGLKLPQIAASARRMKRQHGIGLLVVDYLQLIGGRNTQGGNRVQEITEITVGLKALAKELEIPILALSQLSRNVESRENKRPQLSDLRESGSIEQDADVVMFVFREEYYVERERPDENDPKYCEWQTRMSRVAGKAEIIVGKQRHGPTGTVELAFEGAFTRFSNLAREGRP